jgi:hypothetical protein
LLKYSDPGEALTVPYQGFQWLLDPDDDTDTDDAPDVVNVSWGFDQNRNQCITEFQADGEVLKTAGIAVVHSAGNAGSQSSTSISPANYPQSFAAGAITVNNIQLTSRVLLPATGQFSRKSLLGVNIKTHRIKRGSPVKHVSEHPFCTQPWPYAVAQCFRGQS